jgi:hypothetical protein
VHAAKATITKYPEDCIRPLMPAPAWFASSVPPGMVVPFGSVPFNRMVLVPFTSATLTKVRFSWEYVPSPIRESRNVVFPLSSQPHSWYAAQRQVTGLVCSKPWSWRVQSSRRAFVVFVDVVLLTFDVSLAFAEIFLNV